jgi:hypothetical protein
MYINSIGTKINFNGRSDIRTTKKSVNQLVDILQVDISSIDDSDVENNTRKKYEVFTTGVLSNQAEVTSSLFQTVFDQDHTLQSSNELLDITFGIHRQSDTVESLNYDVDASGKLVFEDTTMMMREKISMYQLYAQELLGDKDAYFVTPFGTAIDETSPTWKEDIISDALFINAKRLFSRDGIIENSVGFNLYETAGNSITGSPDMSGVLFKTVSDTSSDVTTTSITGGTVGTLIDSDNNRLGLVFYEKGIIVLDIRKTFDITELLSGDIHEVSGNPSLGGLTSVTDITLVELLQRGTMDDVIDHIASMRFGRTNTAALSFLNKTFVNSTIYFCKASPSQFNYSSNPTFVDENGMIRVVDEDDLNPFTFITTVGLYNNLGELLAVAKTSRPIEKNETIDLSIRVKLDY